MAEMSVEDMLNLAEKVKAEHAARADAKLKNQTAQIVALGDFAHAAACAAVAPAVAFTANAPVVVAEPKRKRLPANMDEISAAAKTLVAAQTALNLAREKLTKADEHHRQCQDAVSAAVFAITGGDHVKRGQRTGLNLYEEIAGLFAKNPSATHTAASVAENFKITREYAATTLAIMAKNDTIVRIARGVYGQK